MFPLIPALIFLILHGPSNFERLAESGRLPSALAVFQREVNRDTETGELGREDVSRRALASIIAASGNRTLTEAFASMFLAGNVHEDRTASSHELPAKVSSPISDGPSFALQDGFIANRRTRDGPIDSRS